MTTAASGELHGPGFGLALVFVLYAYGGWNDAVFVAAEVRDQRRNMPRALFYGIGLITLLYLAVNAAYLKSLGFEGVRQSSTPAASVVENVVGHWGGRAISALVMISALGAINGLLLAGSRIYAVMGEDFRLFSWLRTGGTQAGAPVAAIVLQGGVSIVLVFGVGTAAGRDGVDHLLRALGLADVPWEAYFGGFEALVAGTAPVFWAFFLLTGVSVFVLRVKHPQQRPFSIPLYPLPAVVFCLTCAYMFYCSLEYAKSLVLLAVVPVALGLPLYLLCQVWTQRRSS
ncbi:MAG: amino acid permease [Pirellulales bacterium]